MKTTVCLLAKAPQIGAAKTRLGPALGLLGTARFAEALLLDALSSWKNSELLIAHTGSWTPRLWEHVSIHAHMQQGEGNLGQRMERVVRAALRTSDAAIVVGTDIPGLGDDDARLAATALQTHDAVLGPSRDGGFYLMGLKRCPEGLLAGVSWSCAETFDETRRRLTCAGMSVALLPRRFDVDESEDLRHLQEFLDSNPTAMPCTRAFLGSNENQAISVIVPILNEAKRLENALLELREIPGIAQIIVSDGGSNDGSVSIARSQLGVDLVRSKPGRARQMNTGAKRALGGILLFLHADARLPKNASAQIRSALGVPGALGGAFRLRTDYDAFGRSRRWVAPFLRLADMRSRYTSLPYGDQAQFVRASTFRDLDGYREMPLFEDLDFAQRLLQRGKWARAHGPLRVSGRRFQERPLYYLGLMNTFPLLYRLGVSPQRLAAFYKHTR